MSVVTKLDRSFGLLEVIDQEVEIHGKKELIGKPVPCISYDSRQSMQEGGLFVAIHGLKTNGKLFINQAIKKGARIIVCESFDKEMEREVLYIKVENARKALASLSRAFYGTPDENLTMVGVTGTNGKTTVALLAQAILEDVLHEKAGFIGTLGKRSSFNEPMLSQERTTPESLDLHNNLSQMLSQGAKGVSMEVSSHSLELDRVYGIEFDVAVFTNLSQDHLDFHKTMENYFSAKKKLFEVLKPESGYSVINVDDEYGKKIKTQRTISYSLKNSRADITAVVEKISLKGTEVKLKIFGKEEKVLLPLIGLFNVYNSLAGVGIGLALNTTVSRTIDSLLNVKSVDGRMMPFQSKDGRFAVIDYAHTPDALEKALQTILRIKESSAKLITVFGCGGNRDKDKRPMMGKVASLLSDFVILTSDNSRNEETKSIIKDIKKGFIGNHFMSIENREKAIKHAIEMINPKDVVLVAGKGHETYQEINEKRVFFNDSEVINNIFYGGESNAD